MKQFKDISVILLATATMTLGMNTAFADYGNKSTTQQATKSQDADHMKKMDKKLEKMKKELSLSDEQVQKIRAIMMDAHVKMKAEMQAMHDKMTEMRDATAADIKEQLNDKQKVTFDKMRAEHKAKHDKEMKAKHHD